MSKEILKELNRPSYLPVKSGQTCLGKNLLSKMKEKFSKKGRSFIQKIFKPREVN